MTHAHAVPPCRVRVFWRFLRGEFTSGAQVAAFCNDLRKFAGWRKGGQRSSTVAYDQPSRERTLEIAQGSRKRAALTFTVVSISI